MIATVTGQFHMDKGGNLYRVLTLRRPSQKPRHFVDLYVAVWQRKDQEPESARADVVHPPDVLHPPLPWYAGLSRLWRWMRDA